MTGRYDERAGSQVVPLAQVWRTTAVLRRDFDAKPHFGVTQYSLALKLNEICNRQVRGGVAGAVARIAQNPTLDDVLRQGLKKTKILRGQSPNETNDILLIRVGSHDDVGHDLPPSRGKGEEFIGRQRKRPFEPRRPSGLAQPKIRDVRQNPRQDPGRDTDYDAEENTPPLGANQGHHCVRSPHWKHRGDAEEHGKYSNGNERQEA